ncbi:MAG: DoxX family protein, partial [Flavobacteriales bacterium]|nr:DoxX family protein [Flavobacteriales bacterium]
MKHLVYFARIIVGGLFVISGLIKANDPLGFSYKLGEYFEESALGLPFLEPYALGLAMLACLAEVVLGFAVIFGGRMKLATWSLLVLTVFFGWLTLYTATCDPQGTYTVMVDGQQVERGVTCVTDCGCFGDAMKGSLGRSLTPWESFYKDLVLFILLIPIFMRAVLGKGITLNSTKDDRIMLLGSLVVVILLSWVFSWFFPVIFTLLIFGLYFLLKQSAQRPDWPIAGMVAIVTVAFMWYSYAYLPTRDYRPYAVGENILEQMKSAEELGIPAPEYVYDYTMVNEDTGEEMVITSKEYMDEKWWERKEWAIDKERTGSAR